MSGKGDAFLKAISARPWVLPTTVCLIFLARKWPSVLRAQPFAEDGPLFLQQNYELGLAALAEPYSGYFHTVPRIGAFLAGALPIHDVPRGLMAFSLVVTWLVLRYLASDRLRELPRPWIFLCLAFLPIQGETVLNLTNTIWWCGLFLFFVSLAEDARTWRGALGETLAVFLAGISGPFAVLFMPLLLLRWYVRRSKKSFAVIVAAGLAGLIQLVPLFAHGAAAGSSASLDAMDRLWLVALAQRIFGAASVGIPVMGRWPEDVQIGLLALLLGGWVVLAWRRKSHLLLASWSALVLTCASFVVRIKVPTHFFAGEGDRYFFYPLICVALALAGLATDGARWGRRVAALFLVAFVANGILLFDFKKAPYAGWRNVAHCFGGPTECRLPGMPQGWDVHYHPALEHLWPWQRQRSD